MRTAHKARVVLTQYLSCMAVQLCMHMMYHSLSYTPRETAVSSTAKLLGLDGRVRVRESGLHVFMTELALTWKLGSKRACSSLDLTLPSE